MTKATHNGTCQACGRQQAVNPSTGRLAKHGYTVAWGFFSGTCVGSDELPMEQSHSRADSTIILLGSRADRNDEMTVADIETVEIEIKSRSGRSDEFFQFKNEAELAAWIKSHPKGSRYCLSTFDRMAAQKLAQIRREAQQMREHVEFLKGLIAERFGQDLYPRETREDKAARIAEKKARPTKASVKRECEKLNREYERLTRELPSRWDLPMYLHQYRPEKHDRIMGERAPQVHQLIQQREAAQASLR